MKRLIFYLLFPVLATTAYMGSYFIDNLSKQKVTITTASVQTQNEGECLDRLFSDAKPLLVPVTCGGNSFNVPKHWYLFYNNLCDGRFGGAGLLDDAGFQDYNFRVKNWYSFLKLLGFSYLGVESLEFGGDFENLMNIFQSSLGVAGFLTIGLEGTSEIIHQMSPLNSNKVLITWDRNSLGKISRDYYYTSKFSTYRNALIRLSKDLSDASNKIDAYSTISESSIDIGLNEASISKTIFVQVGLCYAYSEFLYQVAERLTEWQNEIDPALREVANKILQQTDSELKKTLGEFLSQHEDQQKMKDFIEGIKISLSVVNLIKSNPLAVKALAAIDVLGMSWDFYTQMGEKQYNIPFFHATMGYTLAERNLGYDCLGLLVRSLSLTLADKCINDYFKYNFVDLIINLCSITRENGQLWKKLVSDENRNKELNYLIYGYMSGKNPCLDNINGRVLGLQNQPMPGTNIALINEKDIHMISTTPRLIEINPINIKSTLNDDLGYFHFKVIDDGVYYIRASKEGFCTEEIKINIKQGRPYINGLEYDIINITLQKPKMISSGTLNTKYYAKGLTAVAELTNEECKDVMSILPYGTTFRNKNPNQQNIVLATDAKLTAFGNSTTRYSLPGYCISRHKGYPYSEIVLDKSLNKKEFELVTKTAEKNNWNIKNHSDVQSALWHFSDGTDISKGTIADSLVSIASQASGKKQAYSYKIDSPPTIGSMLCTLFTTFPLYLLSRKLFKM